MFDESFSSALAYSSQPYSEAMVMRPEVMYIPCAASSREKTGNIITFAQFEEGNILTKTLNDSESSEKYDNESIIMSKQDMDAMNSDDDSDHDLISTEMLEDIRDVNHTHPKVNRREARYKYMIVLNKDNRNGKEC